MNRKEKKGGNLSNKEVEEEIRRENESSGKTHPYRGSQDTGDQVVRPLGNEVQKRDGIGETENKERRE